MRYVGKQRPGQAIAMYTDAGYVVGLCTHVTPRGEPLVWWSGDLFDDSPTNVDVGSIVKWRWACFFVINAALRRRLVIDLGVVAVTATLATYPAIRFGVRGVPWTVNADPFTGRRLARKAKPTMPISGFYNVALIKERVVAGWKPEDLWW
jgi:hypothetical protein